MALLKNPRCSFFNLEHCLIHLKFLVYAVVCFPFQLCTESFCFTVKAAVGLCCVATHLWLLVLGFSLCWFWVPVLGPLVSSHSQKTCGLNGEVCLKCPMLVCLVMDGRAFVGALWSSHPEAAFRLGVAPRWKSSNGKKIDGAVRRRLTSAP